MNVYIIMGMIKMQQNFDEDLVKYEERQKVIDEILKWNKFNMYVDLNDIHEDGYSHEEGRAYGKGHYDYGIMIGIKLNELRGEYKTSDVKNDTK